MSRKEKIILEPITPLLIEEIRDRIVEYLDPDKIILFGSTASGDMEESHDIDIYIIKQGVQDARKIEREIDELFAGRFFALDIIVRTPEQVEQSLNSGNSFLLQEIIIKGRILYDKKQTEAVLY